jgi:hypothetical protein
MVAHSLMVSQAPPSPPTRNQFEIRHSGVSSKDGGITFTTPQVSPPKDLGVHT